tara:strand:- start:4816 stop:5994 length:1179 start_codon:yes stop_codon:yes gene_type:complete
MRKILTLGVSVFIGVILSQSYLLASEPENYRVNGKIKNGSSNGEIPAGLSVALHSEHLEKGAGMFHTFTEADGSFEFPSIEVEEDTLYGVSVIHQGATYTQNVNPSDGAPVEIEVFDAVDSDDVVAGFNASVLFTNVDPMTRRVSIMEMITLINESRLTYVPAGGPMDLLRFGLPAGSDQLIVDTNLPGADWIQVDRGFALIASVPPGKHEVMYVYSVPYENSFLEYEKTWRYGTSSLRVVSEEDLVEFQTDLGVDYQSVEIGGIDYRVQEAPDIQRGLKTMFRLTDLPAPTFRQSLSQGYNAMRYEFVGPVSLAILLSVGGLYGTWRVVQIRRRSLADRRGWFPGSDERQVIEDMISELDFLLEEGSLGIDEHRRRSEILNRRLLAIPVEG